ncbi:hypothetical protein GG851_07120 [Bordetella petrii]|nr:hypothetical protein [Bordetella petrii]
MKSVPILLTAALLAGCASTAGSPDQLARYGTAPSEQDLYELMSDYRDTLPATRYVSYRDKGYHDSVKKVSYTDEQGQQRYGWEYDFEVATYDTVEDTPPAWSPRRAIFFNGRPLRVEDAAGNPVQAGAQTAPAPATVPTPTPSTTRSR